MLMLIIRLIQSSQLHFQRIDLFAQLMIFLSDFCQHLPHVIFFLIKLLILL